MDDLPWRLVVSLADTHQVETLLVRLQASTETSEKVSFASFFRDVVVCGSTREVVERIMDAARAEIVSLGLTPTLIRIDEWVAVSSCWSSEPPVSEEVSGSVIAGIVAVILDAPWTT